MITILFRTNTAQITTALVKFRLKHFHYSYMQLNQGIEADSFTKISIFFIYDELSQIKLN